MSVPSRGQHSKLSETVNRKEKLAESGMCNLEITAVGDYLLKDQKNTEINMIAFEYIEKSPELHSAGHKHGQKLQGAEKNQDCSTGAVRNGECPHLKKTDGTNNSGSAKNTYEIGSRFRPRLGSKGSANVLESSTGVYTGNELNRLGLSPVFGNEQAFKPNNGRILRSKSLEKPFNEEISRGRNVNCLSKVKNAGQGFWDSEFQPAIKTRIISQAKKNDKSKSPEPKKSEKHKQKGTSLVNRELTDLLLEMNSLSNMSEKVSSVSADEEEEFDYDKESQRYHEQISQIKDAYVVDMPDINYEVQSIKDNGKELSSKKSDSDSSEQNPSALKKIAYFTSVAATTGFYFLMRRHHIL